MAEILDEVVRSGLLPNPVTFVAQLISTIILFLFLKGKVWKPMQQLLEKRRNVIVGELESAKTLNEEAQNNRNLTQTELTNIRVEASQIIEEAKQQAQQVRENLISEAQKEVQYLKEKAQKELDRERQIAQDHMKEQAVEIAFAVAEKLIHANVNNDVNYKLIEDFIKEVGVN